MREEGRSASHGAPAGDEAPLRRQLRASTPASYRWWAHVGLVAAFTITGIVLARVQIEHAGTAEGLFLLATLVFLNFGEYATHRWNMHVLRLPHVVHYRHVVEHHGFFSDREMGIESLDDLRWVLFPPWALPLLVVSVAPFAWLLWCIAPAGWAWLFLLAVLLYYGAYEILHAMAHLPEGHPIGGRPWVRALTRHHRIHHATTLMDRYNFNFVVPLFDAVFGTTHHDPPPGPIHLPPVD